MVKRTHFIFPLTTQEGWPTPALRGVGLEKNVALKKGTIHDSLKITKRTHFIFLPTTEGRWPTPALRGVGLYKNAALNKGTIHNSGGYFSHTPLMEGGSRGEFNDV